jgi:hypothetical protein
MIVLKEDTNIVGRNRMLGFGRELIRNACVYWIVYRASLDDETIAEENGLRGGPGSDDAG